jgi:Putative Flp pilus-assembly TadE/G-like
MRWDDLLKGVRGSMTIPAIVMFALLVAVGGLGIDLQRLYGAHGQMQAYVDDVALAAAAELDGQSGALSRAVDAAIGGSHGPLLNTSTNPWNEPFTTNATLAVRKLIFLSGLTNPDPSPIDSAEPHAGDTVTCTVDVGSALPACITNPSNSVLTNTQYVEVLASPRTINYLVLPVADAILRLVGAQDITSSATVGLRATAGFKKSVCDLTPMMICNPDESAGNTDPNAPFNVNGRVGQLIQIKAGGGTFWGPGDYGWINVPPEAAVTDCEQGGNQDVGCVLGLVNPLTQCFNSNRISVQPGNSSNTAFGIDARFDIYPNSDNLGPAHNVHTDARFAPSVDITKGLCNTKTTGGTTVCNYSTAAARCPNPNAGGSGGFSLASTVTAATSRSVKMPRDTQFCNGTGTNCQSTPDASHRFGNGVWDRAGYWAANHGGAALPTALLTGSAPDGGATRYEVYRYEIDNNLVTDYSPGSDLGENGDHTGGGTGKYCSTQPGVNNPNRDRRVLYVAVVNCQAAGLHGNSQSNIPVVAYLKVFITEPVGYDDTTGATWVGVSTGSSQSVWGEVVGVIKPSDSSSIVHVYPVLYR